MFSSINFLFLISLAFTSWIILCYFEQIDGNRRANRRNFGEFETKPNYGDVVPGANFYMSGYYPSAIHKLDDSFDKTTTKQDSANGSDQCYSSNDLYLSFLCIFVCLYVVSHIIKLTEAFLAKRMYERLAYMSTAIVRVATPESITEEDANLLDNCRDRMRQLMCQVSYLEKRKSHLERHVEKMCKRQTKREDSADNCGSFAFNTDGLREIFRNNHRITIIDYESIKNEIPKQFHQYGNNVRKGFGDHGVRKRTKFCICPSQYEMALGLAAATALNSLRPSNALLPSLPPPECKPNTPSNPEIDSPPTTTTEPSPNIYVNNILLKQRVLLKDGNPSWQCSECQRRYNMFQYPGWGDCIWRTYFEMRQLTWRPSTIRAIAAAVANQQLMPPKKEEEMDEVKIENSTVSGTIENSHEIMEIVHIDCLGSQDSFLVPGEGIKTTLEKLPIIFSTEDLQRMRDDKQ